METQHPLDATTARDLLAHCKAEYETACRRLDHLEGDRYLATTKEASLLRTKTKFLAKMTTFLVDTSIQLARSKA